MTFFDFASKTKIRVKAALFCALLPFAFGSCTDIFQQADASVLTDAAVIGSGESAAVLTDGEKAFLRFGINGGAAKTAFPSFTTDVLSDIIIYSAAEGSDSFDTVGYWDSDDSQTAYAKMTGASVAVNTGTYEFEIYASASDCYFYEKKKIEVSAATSSINFSPVLLTLADFSALKHGSGGVNITLSYNTDNVVKVLGGLYTLEGAQIPGYNDEELVQQLGGKVTYAKTGVTSGIYLVVFKFYADEAKTQLLGAYREYAYIASNLTSSSTPSISALGKLFTIDLNLNDGVLLAGTTAPASYTRQTPDIFLPEPVKSGFTFGGWYEAADFSDDAVEVIPYGSSGNKTFYAKWNDTGNVTITFDPNGGTIATASQEVSINTLANLTSAASLGLVPPSGKSFSGWALSASAAESAYSDGQSIKVSAATTLYAFWSELATDEDKSKDTDKDGLTDYDELAKYFTDPTSPDTDGDGWKDGEEIRMYSANTLAFSPLIADVPDLKVTFDGKPTFYYKYTTSEGKSTSESVTTNTGTTGSSSTTRTNTVTHNVVNGWNAGFSFGHKWGANGNGATVESNWQASFGYNGNVSYGDTYTFSEVASQGWSKSWSNGKSDTETSGKTMTGGLVVINAKFSNPSNTAYNVKNVNVSIKRIPNNVSAAAIPMASIPVKELGVIGPGKESSYVIEKEMPLAQMEELLKWSSGLSIDVSGYTISTFQNGVLQPNDFTESTTRVRAQTALVNIDFGPGSGLAPLRYNVAVKNKYNKNSTGINDIYTKPTLKEVFEKILNYKEGTDYIVSNLGYLRKLKSVENASTAKDGAWFVNLETLDGGSVKKTLFTPFEESSPADYKWSLNSIELNPGDVVNIIYSVDKDEDGLPLNEELIYGTDDTKVDTDGDGLGDFEEIYGWYKEGIGLVSTYSPTSKITTNPKIKDTDGDDLLDYSTDASLRDPDPKVPKDSDDTRLGTIRYATTLGGKFTDFTFDASGKATLYNLYEYIYLDITPKIAFANIKVRQESGDYVDLDKNKVIKLSLGTNKLVVMNTAPSGKTQEYTLTVDSKLRDMSDLKASSELTGGGVTNFTWTSYVDDRMKQSAGGGYILYGVKGREQALPGDTLDETNAATDDTPDSNLKGKSEFWVKLTPDILSKGLLSVKQLDTGTKYGFYIYAYTTDANNKFVSRCLGSQFLTTGNTEEGVLRFRARYMRDIEDHDGGYQQSEYYWTFEDDSGMNFGKFSVDRDHWYDADDVSAPYYSWGDSKPHKEEPSDTAKMLTISKKFNRTKDQSFTVYWHGKEADKYTSLDDYLGTVTANFSYNSKEDTWTCSWSCAGAESENKSGSYSIKSNEKQLKKVWQIINRSSGEIEFVWDWSWDLDWNNE